MTLALMGAAFIQGLAGSLHCMGMCGPFVHILNSDAKGRWTINILYNGGRSLSYAFTGLLLGFFGAGLNRFLLSNTAAILGAALLLFAALTYLIPSLKNKFGFMHLPPGLMKRLGEFLRKDRNRKGAAALFGLVSGLLPCGLLLPAYGLALSTGNPIQGALLMIVFSLGTYPALFSVLGISGLFWNRLNRSSWRLVMGLIMVAAAGFILYMRVALPHQHHMH